jgi:hypothetical protein
MKIDEFTSAEEQLALWKLVSDNVWGAISKQAEDEAKERAVKKAQAKKVPKAKASSTPIPSFVPPPPPMPKAKSQQTASKQGASNPVVRQSQQTTGVANVIQPTAPANTQNEPYSQQALKTQQSALAVRKKGALAK